MKIWGLLRLYIVRKPPMRTPKKFFFRSYFLRFL